MGKRSSNRQQVTEYLMSLHYGFGLGEIDTLRQIKIGEKVAWKGNVSTQTPILIAAPGLFGGELKEGGVSGTAYFLPGADDQVLPESLAARFGLTSATSPAFRGFGSLFFVGSDYQTPGTETYTRYDGEFLDDVRRHAHNFKGFYWGHNTPFIREVEITATCNPKGLNPSLALIPNEDFPDYPDANPAHIIFGCLTDTDFGKGDPLSMFDIDDWNAVAQTLYDEKFGLSLGWHNQAKIEDFIDEIIDHIQAVLFIHPATGKWTLKLLRDDYETGSLETFNMDNAVLKSFQRKAWGEIVNEVVLTWTNPLNEEEETVTMQDLAAIATQGDVSSASANMYAIRKRSLANTICARELAQRSAPLAAVELEIDRSNWQKLPGAVVRLDWSEHDLSGLVFRVMRISKPSKSGKISVSLMEDIFSLTKPALQPDTSSQWEDPSDDPEELEQSKIITLPYTMSVAVTQNVGEDSIVYPDALTGVLAHHSSADVIEIEVYSQITRPDGQTFYEKLGVKPVVGHAILLSAFDAEAETSYSAVPGAATGRTPVEGGLALIGDGTDENCELCLVKADPVEGWLLQRGVYDTVPKNWPIGTQIWFFESAEAIADYNRIRGVGEIARYKLLARTSLGTIDVGEAPAIATTVSDRAHRPLRPANVKVNDQAFGAVDISGGSTVTVTWSRRNRLSEDSIPLAWDAADVLPERGQTTAIRLIASNGSVIKTWPEVPAQSFTFNKSELGAANAAYIQVLSTRDGFGSFQNWGAWLLDGGADPGDPPNIPSVDGISPPNQGKVETPRSYGSNICSDPFFQDRDFWNYATSQWQSVSRSGSSLPGQIGAPKAIVLSDQWYTGDVAQSFTSDLIVGLPLSGEDLYFFARAVNNSTRSVTVSLSFFESDTGDQVGSSSEITFAAGESESRGAKVSIPSGADSVKFAIASEGGQWSGEAGVSDIHLVEYSSVSDTEFRSILDDARDAINDARNRATDLLDEADRTLAWAAGKLAEDAQLGAQLSLLNWLADPLFETGTDGWRATGGGMVLPIAGSPKALQTIWTFSAGGRASGVELIWPERRKATADRSIQVGVETGMTGVCSEVVVEAVWLDDAGAELSVSEVARGTDGRLTGIVAAPADAAEVYIRMAPVASEAGTGGFIVRRPLVAYALPGQVDVDAFSNPENELVARIAYLERVLGGMVEQDRNLVVETRRGRAGYRENVQAIIDETSARVTAISQLTAAYEAADASLNTALSAKASITYVDDAVASEAGARATAIQQIEAAYQAADSALQTDINTRATISYVNTAVADEASARATAISNVTAAYEAADASLNTALSAKASITYVDDAVASEAGARATAIQQIEAAYQAADSALQTDINTRATISYVNTAVADEASARATAISNVTAAYEAADAALNTAISSKASITYVDDAVADEASARATAISSVQSSINGVSASVSTNASAIATLQGAAAIYEILVAAGGGDPAIARLLAGTGGSEILLAASKLILANMGTGEDEYQTVMEAIAGQAFFSKPIHINDGNGTPVKRLIVGPDTDWLLWLGDANKTAATATLANSDFALTATGQIYIGGSLATTSGGLIRGQAIEPAEQIAELSADLGFGTTWKKVFGVHFDNVVKPHAFFLAGSRVQMRPTLRGSGAANDECTVNWEIKVHPDGDENVYANGSAIESGAIVITETDVGTGVYWSDDNDVLLQGGTYTNIMLPTNSYPKTHHYVLWVRIGSGAASQAWLDGLTIPSRLEVAALSPHMAQNPA